MYIKICHVYIECTYICTLEVNLRPKCKRQIRKATRQKQKKKIFAIRGRQNVLRQDTGKKIIIKDKERIKKCMY